MTQDNNPPIEEAKAGGETQQSPRQVVLVEGSPLPTYYANNVNSTISVWDVRLEFGLIENSDREKLELRNLARVILSPPQAKALELLLGRQLKLYERRFGAIPTSEQSAANEGEDDSDDL